MDFRVLEYFLTVAREENVSHAAEILHVSQPTISRQLMQLEDEIGQTLFLRGNKNMTLTKEGLLFKNRAEEILSLYHKAISEVRQEQEISGELFIGTGETDAFYYLADRIRQFQTRYPKVRFHMISSDSDAIKENIDKGVVDIGFLFGPTNLEKYFFKKLDMAEQWGALLPQGHRLEEKEWIVVDDLINERLICPRRRAFQSVLDQWFGRQADAINIAATYNLINTAIMMTQKNIGITLCIEKKAYSDMGLTFIPLKPCIHVKPIVIWKNQKIFSPVMEEFLSYLTDSKFK